MPKKNKNQKIKKSKNPIKRSVRPSKKFEVLVMATMSAGKTSFVNAFIGHELLHMANEATTSCLTSVKHRRGMSHFRAACFSEDNRLLYTENPASATTLRNWNALPEVYRIELEGSFRSSPQPAPSLILHDTPGPNNSQDERHAQLMLKAMRRGGYQAVCYVLNASQLATHDERTLLEKLRDEVNLSDVPVYFILNKVDVLDPEHGESITAYIEKAKLYLIDIGFKQPVIVPSMANISLYAHKALLEEPLTRGQRLRLQQAIDAFDAPSSYLIQASEISQAVKAPLLKALTSLQRSPRQALDEQAQKHRRLKQLQMICGVQTVQALIKYQRQFNQIQ